MPRRKPAAHRFDHELFRVEPGARVRLAERDPSFCGGLEGREDAQRALAEDVSALALAQERLWASRNGAVLIVFQAMDAAGKDGTIKHVLTGVNPQGCRVTAFKAPGPEELLHDFLWRPMQRLPARGEIAIFNRSYYEEVLVVRVHPELLERQRLPREYRARDERTLTRLWRERYERINRFEALLHDSRITLVKLFLHVSREEQRRRFIARLQDQQKYWKFDPADVRERAHWDEYQEAYERMLEATSAAHAPWYVVPADNKWYMRAVVADVIAAHIQELDLELPRLSRAQQLERKAALAALLVEEPSD